MSNYLPVQTDFEPLGEARDAERIDRPSLSYWQDVWRRLKKNTRAVVSLYMVVGLLLFTLAGPLVWRVDPALQDLEQISQGPNLGRYALVIADQQPAREVTSRQLSATAIGNIRAPQNLRTLGRAHSEGVTLAWDAVPGAVGYQLFRHELNPSGIDDLGLPLGELRANQLSYLDRLGLQTRGYYYSVVAVFGDGAAQEFTSLAVEVEQAIRLSEAFYRGLVDNPDDSTLIGTQIRLEMHPLGTDYLGRDMLARLMWGAHVIVYWHCCATALRCHRASLRRAGRLQRRPH